MACVVKFAILFLGCILSQTFETEAIMEVSPYSNLMQHFPFCSALCYSTPDYISASTMTQLAKMASMYRLPVSYLSDVYQLINASAGLPLDKEMKIMKQLIEAFNEERITQGYMPWWYQYNKQFLPNTSVSTTKVSSVSSVSSGLYRRSPDGLLEGVVKDVSSNVGAVFKNLGGMVDYLLPNTTRNLSNTINSILGTNIPASASETVDNLGNKINNSMRSLLSDVNSAV